MPNRKKTHIAEHLANERTYLAGLRTSFALISLGFATSRFSQFILELRGKTQELSPNPMAGSHRFGEGMVFFGAILIVLSMLHYARVRKCIEEERPNVQSRLIWLISLMSLLFAVTSILLFFAT